VAHVCRVWKYFIFRVRCFVKQLLLLAACEGQVRGKRG